MQEVPPIGRDTPGRSWYGLIGGVMLWRCKPGPLEELIGGVAPEPVFARLEASDNGVTGRACVSGGMLARRVVTTPNMPALRTPAEVKPPTTGLQALDAASSAGCYVRNNGGIAH